MNIWTPGMTLDEIEKKAILEAMQFFHSNKSKVASSLGISEKTLYNKLEKYKKEAPTTQ